MYLVKLYKFEVSHYFGWANFDSEWVQTNTFCKCFGWEYLLYFIPWLQYSSTEPTFLLWCKGRGQGTVPILRSFLLQKTLVSSEPDLLSHRWVPRVSTAACITDSVYFILLMRSFHFCCLISWILDSYFPSKNDGNVIPLVNIPNHHLRTWDLMLCVFWI